jgi:hypothetical protein
MEGRMKGNRVAIFGRIPFFISMGEDWKKVRRLTTTRTIRTTK